MHLGAEAPREIGVVVGRVGVAEELIGSEVLPLLGRVSMDLIAIDVTGHDVGEGDWLTIDFDLPRAAAESGMSQYELLTGLGRRFDRMG